MGAAPTLAKLAHQWYDDFVHTMLGAVAVKHPEKEWIGEKSPKSMQPLMPGAHYVYIIRDGRDVLVSLFWHHVRLGGFKTWCDNGPPVPADDVAAYKVNERYFEDAPQRLLARESCVRQTARRWRDVVESDLQTMEALGDDGNGDGTRAVSLRYEELLGNTDSERARMYRFLGLEPSEARELASWDMTLPGVPQTQSQGFFRKGVSGDWQTYFHDDAKQWFKDEAGELLIRLGYAADNNW